MKFPSFPKAHTIQAYAIYLFCFLLLVGIIYGMLGPYIMKERFVPIDQTLGEIKMPYKAQQPLAETEVVGALP